MRDQPMRIKNVGLIPATMSILAFAVSALGACGAAVAPGGDAGSDVSSGTDAQVDVASDGPGCRLPNGGICPAGQSCPAGDGCNTCMCPPGGGSASCTLGNCVGDGGSRLCATARDCASGQFCEFPLGSCSSRGVCQGLTPCFRPETYCSCNSETYQSCSPDRPTRSVGPCGAVDAGVTCEGAHFGRGSMTCVGPDDSPRPPECCTNWQCDTIRNVVLCNAIPPTCAPGWVNTVNVGCWGPCVPFANCAPIRCEAGRCPDRMRCDNASGMCTLAR